MNNKNLRRQIISATVLLLICAISLTGATFAWYVYNTSVSATGINVTAQTDGISFEITAKTSAGEPVFDPGVTTANLGLTSSSAIRMYPIHPIINNAETVGNRVTWGHALSTNIYDAATGAALTMMDLSTDIGNHVLKSEEDDVYALAVDFYVRLNADSSDPNIVLKDIVAKDVSIVDESPAGKTNLLAKCIYLVVEGDAGAYQISNDNAIDADSVFASDKTSGVLIERLSDEDAYKTIRVYVFFEGQDKDCKSSQYSASSLSISVDFEGVLAPKD